MLPMPIDEQGVLHSEDELVASQLPPHHHQNQFNLARQRQQLTRSTRSRSPSSAAAAQHQHQISPWVLLRNPDQGLLVTFDPISHKIELLRGGAGGGDSRYGPVEPYLGPEVDYCPLCGQAIPPLHQMGPGESGSGQDQHVDPAESASVSGVAPYHGGVAGPTSMSGGVIPVGNASGVSLPTPTGGGDHDGAGTAEPPVPMGGGRTRSPSGIGGNRAGAVLPDQHYMASNYFDILTAVHEEELEDEMGDNDFDPSDPGAAFSRLLHPGTGAAGAGVLMNKPLPGKTLPALPLLGDPGEAEGAIVAGGDPVPLGNADEDDNDVPMLDRSTKDRGNSSGNLLHKAESIPTFDTTPAVDDDGLGDEEAMVFEYTAGPQLVMSQSHFSHLDSRRACGVPAGPARNLTAIRRQRLHLAAPRARVSPILPRRCRSVCAQTLWPRQVDQLARTSARS
eukprot:g7618.t1